MGTWFSNPAADHAAAASGTGVGKYLAAKAGAKKQGAAAADLPANGGTGPPAAKKAKAGGYGNFEGW